MEILNVKKFGPLARYSDPHLFLTMDALYRDGRVGRKGLLGEVGLGEGSMRSVLAILRDWRWVDVRQTGVMLTDLGRTSFAGFNMTFVDVGDGGYGVGPCTKGILVKGASADVPNPMAVRDTAIRNGAKGAVVFVMDGGRVTLPPHGDVYQPDPEFAETLKHHGMEDGDVLVLVGASSPLVARLAAAAVGLAIR